MLLAAPAAEGWASADHRRDEGVLVERSVAKMGRAMKTLAEHNAAIHEAEEAERRAAEDERRSFVERAKEHHKSRGGTVSERLAAGRACYIEHGPPKPTPAGVACDNCGFELLRSSSLNLAGADGSRRAHCLACGYCGVMANR